MRTNFCNGPREASADRFANERSLPIRSGGLFHDRVGDDKSYQCSSLTSHDHRGAQNFEVP